MDRIDQIEVRSLDLVRAPYNVRILLRRRDNLLQHPANLQSIVVDRNYNPKKDNVQIHLNPRRGKFRLKTTQQRPIPLIPQIINQDLSLTFLIQAPKRTSKQRLSFAKHHESKTVDLS